jgi:hypothetical protein
LEPFFRVVDTISWYTLLTKVLIINNFYAYQFIGTRTNQVDPDLVDITQNKKMFRTFLGTSEDGQRMLVVKHFVCVLYGCEKQFEVAVSLNHDVMT